MTNRVAARQLRVLEACDRANADNSLAKAVESLGAVEVSRERMAYRGSSQWFTFLLGDVTTEGTILHQVPMPPWWSPSQRFAWRKAFGFADSPNILGRGGVRYASINEARLHGPNERHERITADLTTGEEVPA